MNGPYGNEEGDWWVAVEDAPYLVARREVKGVMYDPIGNRLVYEGKQKVTLWDDDRHETTEDCRLEGCHRTDVLSWHFQEVER